MICGDEISDTLAYVFEKDDPGLPFVNRDSNELILVLDLVNNITLLNIILCVLTLNVKIVTCKILQLYLEFRFDSESDETIV